MAKTASLRLRSNDISTVLQAIKYPFLIVLLLSLIASCSTKQALDPKTQPIPATEIEGISVEAGKLSAQQHIELAQSLETNAAINELLIATKLFYQQQDYLKALWLADKTLPLVDEQIADNMQQKIQLVLIKASSLQQLGYYAQSHVQLNHLEQYANDNKITLTTSYYRLLSATFKAEQLPIPALNARLFAFSSTPNSTQTAIQNKAESQEEIDSIWQDFQHLSQWQLNLLALGKAPNSKGWLQLTAIANKFGSNQAQMQYQLAMWQKKFKKHPAADIAKQLQAQIIIPRVIENIAVILPLSGNQQASGRAVQQGILASFANDKTKSLHFLDSSTLNWYGLSNELSTLNIDYVIGPLLKANVDKYISHTSAQNQLQNDDILNASNDLFATKNLDNIADDSVDKQDVISDNITAIDSQSAINDYLQQPVNTKAIDTLLLNIPAQATLTSEHTVLSMRPEDEAKQAATTLSSKQFHHPIVLSQKNTVSKRIAQAFVNQWLLITGNKIEVVYYDTGSQMQANIKTSLSVDSSQARIKTLKSRLNQPIKTQTRNRRDIDMIYLVGTPEQTRLVKPYIEVNISPFADIIPVFASSRSHSTQIDYSSNSDLQGLTFTEIPWLLTDAQNSELATLSQQLWPKRSDGLSRLFAMGYDSYQLVEKIPLMQQVPYLQHWGQTGVLKLGDNNILTRSLLWGLYQRNKVVTIVME